MESKKERALREKYIAETMEECRIISLLLFDRAEDGSYKPEHLKNVRERIDDDDNNDVVWISLLACRLAMLAATCDPASDHFGMPPGMILGRWAGILVYGEIETMAERYAQIERDAKNN